MANPQIEDGHIDIANEIADKLCSYRLCGEEWQVLWVILRKTYGWHKKEDWISLSQFASLTGMKKPSIIRALKKLFIKNIVSKKANANGKSYSFNKDYDTWKPLAKKLILAKELMTVSKKANLVLAKELPTKENITKENITKEKNTYIRIFNFWNSLKIIEHKDTDKLRKKIMAALKIYTPEELEGSMKNYAYIFSTPDKFYWTYKWQLKDFLDRGVERFLPVNFRERDFLKRVYKSKAELEEERSLGILSRVFREEEEKENYKKGNDSNPGSPEGSI